MVGVDGSVAGVDGLGRATAGSFASRAASCWSLLRDLLSETARLSTSNSYRLLPTSHRFFTDFSTLSWDDPTMRLRVRLLVRPCGEGWRRQGGGRESRENLEEVGTSRRKFETVLGPSRNKYEQVRKR